MDEEFTRNRTGGAMEGITVGLHTLSAENAEKSGAPGSLRMYYCLNTTIPNGGRLISSDCSKPWSGIGSESAPP